MFGPDSSFISKIREWGWNPGPQHSYFVLYLESLVLLVVHPDDVGVLRHTAPDSVGNVVSTDGTDVY